MWGLPIQLREELEYTYTTDAEWDREEACDLGYANPDKAWIVTGRDAVHANPYLLKNFVKPPMLRSLIVNH